MGIATNGVLLSYSFLPLDPNRGTDIPASLDLVIMLYTTQNAFGVDLAGGHPEESGEYSTSSGAFIINGWNHRKSNSKQMNTTTVSQI